MTPSPLEPPPALLCHVTLLVHAVLTLQGGAGLQAEGGGGGGATAEQPGAEAATDGEGDEAQGGQEQGGDQVVHFFLITVHVWIRDAILFWGLYTCIGMKGRGHGGCSLGSIKVGLWQNQGLFLRGWRSGVSMVAYRRPR